MLTQTMLKQENKSLRERIASLEKELAWQAQTILTLQVSEERFRSAFDNMLEGVQIIAYDWHYLYLNAAAEKHNRRPNQELLGRRYTEMWPGIEAAPVFAVLKECMEERVAKQLENRFVYPDGSISWFELKIQPVAEGVVIFSFDITERKWAEEQLRENEARFHGTLDAMQEGVLLIGRDWRYLYINKSAEMQGRRPAEELLGRTVLECWPGIEATDFFQLEQKVMQECVPAHIEGPFTFPDGETRWFHWNIQPASEGLLIVTQDITERKQAEQERYIALEKYRVLFETFPLGISVTDAVGNLLEANRESERLLGISREDHTRRTYDGPEWRMVRPDGSPMPPDEYASVRALKEKRLVENVEMGIVKGGGEITWINVTAVPLRLEGYGVVITYGDITERKRAEEALRKSENKMRSIFRAAPTGIGVVVNRVFKEVNQRLCEITGYNRDELIDQSARIIYPSDEEYEYVGREKYRQIAEKGTGTVETRFRRKDSTLINVLMSSTPIDPADLGRGVTFTALDITERKRAEEALRESEERYRKLLEFAPVAIAVHADDRIIFINRTGVRLLGAASEEEIIGRSVLDIMHPAGLNQARERQRRMMAGEQGIYPVEDVYLKLDGTPINVEVSVTPLSYQGKLAFQAIVADITERKRAEAELQETLKELKRSNVELEQFAYVASHDLQEPLRAVAGMVQLLQKKYQGQLDEQADLYITYLVEAAARMQRLINDLLAYSRVGRRGQPFTPVNTAACLQLVLKNLAAVVQESRASITWDNLPTVAADSTQLSQLFQNLIGNALKFRGDKEPQIHLSAVKVANAWQFSVRDNGIGIEPQYFERIFQVFQRLHTREEYPGTGIGLALCQKIVERHGGVIWVESQVGQGSTFHFTLPIRSMTNDN